MKPKVIGSRIPFRCTLCGECCRVYWVPVTLGDIRRIYAATGRDPGEFLATFPVEQAEQWDSPIFLLRSGGAVRRYYLVLRKRADGSCIFLKTRRGDAICAVHSARPLTCRFYPFQYRVNGDIVEFHLNEDAVGFCPGLGIGRVHDFANEAAYAERLREEVEETRAFAAEWNRDVVTGVVGGGFGELIERIRRTLMQAQPTHPYYSAQT